MFGEEIILKNQNFIKKNWIKEKRIEYELEKRPEYNEKTLVIKELINKIQNILNRT